MESKMKLALVGNCQLEVLGDLIKNHPALHEDKFTYVFNTPIYKLNEKEHLLNFYHELEQCDVIFMQYHSRRWGALSTASLSQYFDLTILPTLESRVSTPQLGYYDLPIPDLMVYIDYRFLHLYLTGHNHRDAVSRYHQVQLSSTKQLAMLEEDAKKYKTLYQNGKVCFDYSEDYFRGVSENTGSYSTISHPNNEHLGLLLRAIYQHIFGSSEKFDLQGNDMLLNYTAPKMGSGDESYFMMRPTGLSLAGKINFAFFEHQDKAMLQHALLKSAYYQSLSAEYMNI